MNSSFPNPGEVEDEGTPGDADIPDNIARALLDALQEEQTGSSLPPVVIPLAHIPATQLKQCLLIAREPSDNTIQATLELIFLEQDTSGPAKPADKVSTVNHRCTTNQPNSTGPIQANISRSGQPIPTSLTAEAEEVNLASFHSTNRQSSTLYSDANGTTLNTATTNGNTYSHNARNPTSEHIRPFLVG